MVLLLRIFKYPNLRSLQIQLCQQLLPLSAAQSHYAAPTQTGPVSLWETLSAETAPVTISSWGFGHLVGLYLGRWLQLLSALRSMPSPPHPPPMSEGSISSRRDKTEDPIFCRSCTFPAHLDFPRPRSSQRICI